MMETMTKPPNWFAHSWSGWPGAICLKCFQEDPVEIALADGEIDMETSMPTSPEVEERLKKDNVCPVEGKLEWNEAGFWELHKPDGSVHRWSK